MNFKNKSILSIVLVIVLIVGFSFYYFSTQTGLDNKTPESAQMTEEQKLDILSRMSATQVSNMSEIEKEKILEQATLKDKPANSLSQGEILQFLNKTN